MRESPDPLEPELAPEGEPSIPLFKSVEVQAELEDPPEPALESRRQDATVDEKVAEPEAAPQAPLDPNAKYKQNLKKAQDEWARRRKAGFEDYGAEMAKDAKVWQVYVRETQKADEELVDGWNKSLDVILIFAALFSAISTAFVGISAQNLQQNPADASAQTLLVISRTLLVMSGADTTNSSSPVANQDSSEFRPSRTVVAINALWFLSLSLSVAVSLIAMLAKEWCHAFMSGRSGETHERARLRQKRWNEIERLKMIDVLTLLPLLIHLALRKIFSIFVHEPCMLSSYPLPVLFAVGLCVYLWDLNIYVAIPVIIITSISTFIYASTVVHSLTTEHCPYTTGSSKLAKSYIKAWLTTKLIAYISSWANKIPTLSTALSYRCANLGRNPDPEQPVAHSQEMDVVASQMLSWLLVHCPDSNATDLVVYSLAGAEPWLPRLPLLESNALDTVFQSLDKSFENNYGFILRPDVSPDIASLRLRALQFLLGHYNGEGFFHCMDPDVMKGTWSEDYYHRRHSEMSSRIERVFVPRFEIERFSSSDDIRAFLDTFSLKYTSWDEHDSLPWYSDLCPLTLIDAIKAHLGHDIVLHPASLIAVIRQLTNRLCEPRDRWEPKRTTPSQLCFLLLRLYLHSENHNKHQDLQFHIAVAIAATMLNFGSFPGWTHPPERTSPLTRAMELVTYHTPPKQITYRGQRRSLKYSRDLEKQSLLALGLLGLLESSSAHELLAPENLETCAAVFESQNVAIEYSYIHSIPSTFTFGVHAVRVVARYFSNGIQPDDDSTKNNANWLRCLSAICDWTLRIEDDNVDHHRVVHSALLSLLCTVVSPEQQRWCTVLLEDSSDGCTKSCLESLPGDMLTKLLSVSLSGNKLVAPTAMRELWSLTKSILALSEDSPAVRSHLLSLVHSTATSVPKNPGELGLLQQWFPHLQTMCVEGTQELLDSGVLFKIWVYYSYIHQENSVAWPFDGPNGPETIPGSRVGEIFRELEEKCKSVVALSNQIWHELPFDELTEGADG
ncbi:hypothetical protein FRC12_006049 [Ceratobasidium sp. 428]|nr:hypothetical protein FRC12_006049 [Ceratobasidium sp. 428]